MSPISYAKQVAKELKSDMIQKKISTMGSK